MEVSRVMEVAQELDGFMENAIEMDDLGVALFQDTSK